VIIPKNRSYNQRYEPPKGSYPVEIFPEEHVKYYIVRPVFYSQQHFILSTYHTCNNYVYYMF